MSLTNHLKTSASSAPKLGAMRKFADGGFIGKLFGTSKPETITEKFARQDAEFRAKHPERFQDAQTPAPTAPAQPSGLGGIRGMLGGSVAKNLQDREKAAGLFKGGAVRKKCVEGGDIKGPGGPTDDLVPIMASNGEFMIKAASAKVLGREVLDALNDVGDEPKNPRNDRVEDARQGEKMRRGGVVSKPAESDFARDPATNQPILQSGKTYDPFSYSAENMAYRNASTSASSIVKDASQQSGAKTMTGMLRPAGGSNTTPPDQFDPELQPTSSESASGAGSAFYSPLSQKRISNFPTIAGLFKGGAVRKMAVGGPVDPLEKRVASIPTGGSTAPEPDGMDDGNDFTRNVNNSLNALGGMGVVASVPLKAAQAGQVGLGAVRSGMNAAPVLQNGMARLAGPAAQVAQAAPDFVAGATGVQRVGGANLPSVISNTQIPIAKATNVALQEGAKANQMAANTRTLGNASAGLGMLDGANQLPAGAPGAAPTSSTGSAPVQPGSPAHGLGISSTSSYQQRQGQLAPDQNAYHGDLTEQINAAMKSGRTDLASTGMRANDIYKTKMPNGTTAYSGYGDGTGAMGGIVNGDGTQAPGRGTVSVVPGMGLGAIRKALTNPDGTEWSAGDNAIMAANIRDGVDQYRGTSRDTRNDPMNQPMTKDQRAAKVRMAEIAAQDRRYSRADAIAQEQLGMTREEHVSKMAKEQQLAEAQAEYLAAGDDPMKLKIAERKLIILGGKQPAPVRAFAVPGGQAFDERGMPYTVASDVYDPDTKQWVQRPQAKAALATPNQYAISHLKSNPKLAAEFDAKYGPGASKQVLGK